MSKKVGLFLCPKGGGYANGIQNATLAKIDEAGEKLQNIGFSVENTYSSIHGVKGETFDALMLLIHGTVGNTLTPSFLANGKTNTELMRIAYVAMTRPRKLLVVAMPKNKAKLSNRFPPDKWDYVEL